MPHERRVDHLYVHGGGRRGVEAWPHVADDDATFVAFPSGSTIDDQVAALIGTLGSGGGRHLVFAHSIGAVPTVIAATRLDIAGMVLIEPALYDIARGEQAIERHVGIVTEARALASAGDLRGFWAILRPLMFGGPFDAARWDEESAVAERWAVTNLPWGHGVREQMVDGIPVLVVTGGWNEEYETIADVLETRGAQHIVLSGAQHRPHDLPLFADAVQEFEESLQRL